MTTVAKSKFDLGECFVTRGAVEALRVARQVSLEFFFRHAAGDWGDVDADDAAENELSLENGYRLFSVYQTRRGEKLWVITEDDRSRTTILLPEEY